jgi:hypothetical protein
MTTTLDIRCCSAADQPIVLRLSTEDQFRTYIWDYECWAQSQRISDFLETYTFRNANYPTSSPPSKSERLRQRLVEDHFEKTLWDNGIRVCIIELDEQWRTVSYFSKSYADYVLAKKFFLMHDLRPTPSSSKKIESPVEDVVNLLERTDETGIVNAKAITPPVQVCPIFSEGRSEKTAAKGNLDPVAQITEGKSKEFLEAESHVSEHSLQVTHQVGRSAQVEEIHTQAGPASHPDKHERKSGSKRLGAAISAAWQCFWQVLNRD